jgi:hypothetical protein
MYKNRYINQWRQLCNQNLIRVRSEIYDPIGEKELPAFLDKTQFGLLWLYLLFKFGSRVVPFRFYSLFKSLAELEVNF